LVVLREGANRIAEDVVDGVLGGSIKNLGQVVTQKLYITGLARPGAEIGVHGRQSLVLAVNEQDFAQVGTCLPRFRQNAHAFGHLHGGPTQIDRVSSSPWLPPRR
jgi:hypothetical protein